MIVWGISMKTATYTGQGTMFRVEGLLPLLHGFPGLSLGH